jgi:hypothetical protein
VVGAFGIATATTVTPNSPLTPRLSTVAAGTPGVTLAAGDRLYPTRTTTTALTATAQAAAANVGQAIVLRPAPLP